ncbi:MAG: type II toxin-antitoxin system HipA family toxin [Myxococcaceae bacterium]
MRPTCNVYLWGTWVGAVSYPPGQSDVAVFEYNPDFLDSGIQIAPLTMPLRPGTFRFPELSAHTFKGLPGMLVDSLPDKFGTQLIDKYLASLGRSPDAITAIDRLHYVGTRGMGALEYQPAEAFGTGTQVGGILDLAEITELAHLTLARDGALAKALRVAKTKQAAFDLIRIGTSAGGARAKAIVALDTEDRLKVGHLDHGSDHTYWLLKFDGIRGNKDRDGADPPGATLVEYIYSEIAQRCGIQMPRCRLLEEAKHQHFLIERFDRVVSEGKLRKLHYTSWCGMSHAHRDRTDAFSYEQLVLVMRQLGLPQVQITELFRRAVFNVVGRNQDDHTKNFGFLMNREGEWSLSPAFDMTYSYDPAGKWTRGHQISLNGKTDLFTREDLLQFGKSCSVSSREASRIIEATLDAFQEFGKLAARFGLSDALKRTIQTSLRLRL